MTILVSRAALNERLTVESFGSYAFFPLIFPLCWEVRCIMTRDIFWERRNIYSTRTYTNVYPFALKNTWLLFIVLLFLLLISLTLYFPLENISSLLAGHKHDVLEQCRSIFNVSYIAVSRWICGRSTQLFSRLLRLFSSWFSTKETRITKWMVNATRAVQVTSWKFCRALDFFSFTEEELQDFCKTTQR